MNEIIAVFKEKYLMFVMQNRRLLNAGIACFSGIVLLIVYFQTAPGPEKYAAAEESVAKWQEMGDDVSYVEMRKALKKVPLLEKKYASVIAQKLFQKNQLADALALAQKSIQQIEDDAPFHAAYGSSTLLIEQGAFQDALEQSVQLKEKMLSQIGPSLDVGDILYAHNLLRIACLQKELKNKPGEKAAWDELEKFLETKQKISDLVFANFREQGLDLSHYIAQRKKEL